MRKLLLIVIVMAFSMPMNAQRHAASRQLNESRPVGIGVKFGANLPNYHYASKDLNQLGRNANGIDTLWMERVRLSFGLQLELPVGENWLLSPELLYLNKGDQRRFYNVPLAETLTYEARVNYLDLRIPLTYVVPLNIPIQPYVFAGFDSGMVLPYFSFGSDKEWNLSGEFSLGNEYVEVNKSNMAPFDLSVFGGLGLRFNVVFDRFSLVMKLEADYNYGLMNTYSKRELASQTPAANLYGLANSLGGTQYVADSRKNRGLEAFLTMVLPLKFTPQDTRNRRIPGL